jgi:hypothetical protein
LNDLLLAHFSQVERNWKPDRRSLFVHPGRIAVLSLNCFASAKETGADGCGNICRFAAKSFELFCGRGWLEVGTTKYSSVGGQCGSVEGYPRSFVSIVTIRWTKRLTVNSRPQTKLGVCSVNKRTLPERIRCSTCHVNKERTTRESRLY